MDRYKYPRTPHLPWSGAMTSDDVTMGDSVLIDCDDIVVTEKLDGENATLYRDAYHARSIDGRHHESRTWVKRLQGEMGHLIPEGWRLCGENMFAQHSITYDSLESYFYMFSIWNEDNVCLDWDEMMEWAELLDMVVPTVLYRGPWDADVLRALSANLDTDKVEGFVVRPAAGFAYEDFASHTAKYVRAGHVQTKDHWMFSNVVANELA